MVVTVAGGDLDLNSGDGRGHGPCDYRHGRQGKR